VDAASSEGGDQCHCEASLDHFRISDDREAVAIKRCEPVRRRDLGVDATVGRERTESPGLAQGSALAWGDHALRDERQHPSAFEDLGDVEDLDASLCE
jgi:hypothetical protein